MTTRVEAQRNRERRSLSRAQVAVAKAVFIVTYLAVLPGNGLLDHGCAFLAAALASLAAAYMVFVVVWTRTGPQGSTVSSGPI